VLAAVTFSILTTFKLVSRHCEKRADQIATRHESDAGVFASALLKLYKENLMPAVLAKRQSTHPDLYDRLIASGVQPDFPRPLPPRKLSVQSLIMSIALGILIARSFIIPSLKTDPPPKPETHASF